MLLLLLKPGWTIPSLMGNKLSLVVRRDRDQHGGGVAVYIENNLPFTITLTHLSTELLTQS